MFYLFIIYLFIYLFFFLIFGVLYMFRTRGLVFKKTVVYAVMVEYAVHASVQAVLNTLPPTRLLIIMHVKHTVV